MIIKGGFSEWKARWNEERPFLGTPVRPFAGGKGQSNDKTPRSGVTLRPKLRSTRAFLYMGDIQRNRGRMLLYNLQTALKYFSQGRIYSEKRNLTQKGLAPRPFRSISQKIIIKIYRSFGGKDVHEREEFSLMETRGGGASIISTGSSFQAQEKVYGPENPALTWGRLWGNLQSAPGSGLLMNFSFRSNTRHDGERGTPPLILLLLGEISTQNPSLSRGAILIEKKK